MMDSSGILNFLMSTCSNRQHISHQHPAAASGPRNSSRIKQRGEVGVVVAMMVIVVGMVVGLVMVMVMVYMVMVIVIYGDGYIWIWLSYYINPRLTD